MKKLKNQVLNYFKDKASLIKAAFCIHNHDDYSDITLAVLLATTQDAVNPSLETRTDTGRNDISLSHACACIGTLMDHLQTTSNVDVAMKSLLTLHFLIVKDSFNLKDHASFYPYYDVETFRNLSTFQDSEMSDSSSCVRWYARVVEQNIIIWREIGLSLYFPSRSKSNRGVGYKKGKILRFSTAELNILMDFVDQVSEVPESSLHDLKRNKLVSEVVKLVVENYKLVQREILIIVKKKGERIESFSPDELTQLNRTLLRYEDCGSRVSSAFVIEGDNEDMRELIEETKKKIEEEEKRRMKMMMMGDEPIAQGLLQL